MRIIYDIKFERKLLTDKQADNIVKHYPIGTAVFIPYIKDEIRIDEELIEAGKFNDNLIIEILGYIKDTKYLGSYQYTNDSYSDYFESCDDFINILYSENIEGLVVNAIFISSKHLDS